MKAPEFDLFKFSDASAAQALRRAIGGAAIADTVKATLQAPGHC